MTMTKNIISRTVIAFEGNYMEIDGIRLHYLR